nr:MAG TPA: tail protein [Caudoviricetes sp.]
MARRVRVWNFTVKFHTHRGQKTGVVIEYGKNLTALEQDEDNSGVYTALLPYAIYVPEGSEDETVVTLPEVTLPIVTSEIVRAKTLILDFSDQFDGVVTEDALRAKANSYIKANPLGATIPTVKVSFEPLWKQPEYSALLERVNLCDTVTIRHSALGVSVSAMVIETVYDTLAERYKSISLGQSKSSMITTISEVQSTVDKVESTVGRFPKLLQTAIGKATGLITGQSGGYVVIHTAEENGQPYELLILDAPSIDEAVNVWRWNVGGLGFSNSGYNGPYETAITADGQIVADFITSGSLVANIIKVGVIQSQDGSSWWDLESGEVVLRAYATSKEVTEVSDRITTIEEQKMLRLVIISSNGNIFKNGNLKTLLSAVVYSWDKDITDTLDANQFIWTRVSEDPEADKVWNGQHFGGAKSVVITGADVKVRATFYCDLIDTTTRQSLL